MIREFQMEISDGKPPWTQVFKAYNLAEVGQYWNFHFVYMINVAVLDENAYLLSV